MKYHSDYTEQYVQDICDALNAVGVTRNKERRNFIREDYKTLTSFLHHEVVMPLNIFTFLNDHGLVNRGRCPYTGEQIDGKSLKWTNMGSRSVYVSAKGHDLMRKEDDEEHERVMGKPRDAAKGNPDGNSTIKQRVLNFSGRVIVLYAIASLISWSINFSDWNIVSRLGFTILLVWTFNDMFLFKLKYFKRTKSAGTRATIHHRPKPMIRKN